MRLLVDENVPAPAVAALRAAGHDVLHIAESSPSSSDDAVLSLATSEQRVLVTFDKDFGELAFRRGLSSRHGVVLLRMPPVPELVASRVVQALTPEGRCAGKFLVVEENRLRERATPNAPE